MKVKDIERTANVAWSPANHHPILLATGTAAQQLDASFSTNASLEIYSLNLGEPGMDMELKASVPTEHRFQKLVWGSYGRDPNGTLVGGCDGGVIQIFNAVNIMKGEKGLVVQQNKHTGPVHTLDFNPFQSNLLATGAGESEIYIWDLNNTTNPMTPGVKSQPFEDVICVAWNRQVQHILASTLSSKCVVWDLRKNEPIIKLTDTVSRVRWKVVAWHPEVATQLCLASEEDQAPVIQLWDLRFATSPLKSLENHQRGILSLAWCDQDSNLLVSCGKDNRILCWNPNSNNTGGEVLSEVAKTNQWSFDVTWCPKNPALVACPNFDGHVSIYSLMGGKIQQVQTTNKIADSFPGMDGYVQAPVPQQSTHPTSVDLSKAPKWLKRPIRASFGFGGNLISFINENSQTQQHSPDQVASSVIRLVFISQVITEPELVIKSAELEKALEYGNFTDYCRTKAEQLTDQHKRNIWYFLKANFEDNPRAELLNLLGYRIEDVNEKLNDFIVQARGDVDGLADQFSNITRPGSYDNSLGLDHHPKTPFKIKTTDDTEGLITQALLLGNTEVAVELCFKAQRFADAIIIAMTGDSELLTKVQYKYLKQSEGNLSSLISALVFEDWASVISNCDISNWKEALVAALTHSSNEDLPRLCELLGNRLEEEGCLNPKLVQDAQLCYICAGSFDKLVNVWSSSVKRSSHELQELVELIAFLQKAVERQDRKVEISGSLADLLSYYASILASQGNLSTALSYLGNSQNEQIANLRDRLCVRLGYKPSYSQAQPRSRHSSRQSFSNYPAPAASLTNPFTIPPVSSYNQFGAGVPNIPSTNQQLWQQTPFNQPQPAKPFTPPPSQPPRPTSVGSAHGGSSITSRPKYIADPSVQSPGSFNIKPAYNTGNVMNQPQSYQTNLISSNYLPQNSLNQPISSMPSNTASLNPMVPPIPQPGQTSLFHQPDPIEPMLPPAKATHYSQYFSAPPGWNDPPVLNKPQDRRTPAKEYTPQEPITHPLFGAAAAQNVPASNGYGDQSQMFNPLHSQQSTLPNNPQFLPPTGPTTFSQPNFNPTVNQGNFNQNAIGNLPPQPAQPIAPPSPPIAEHSQVQKDPIPGEHKVIQNVLDELRNRCSNATNNTQTKRKLEDVARKLETLYDMLREQNVSQNTISVLHQLIRLIESGDYMGCLSLHTQLVSGPDFSQIASFMPGLKVLVQCALQLQVYLS